jgi:hypothetical protein
LSILALGPSLGSPRTSAQRRFFLAAAFRPFRV